MAAANNEFFEALSMLEHERGITAEYLIEKIKAAIVIAVKKNYEVEDDHVMVEIDPSTGKFNVALIQDVVADEDWYDEHSEIGITEAQHIRKSYQVGDRVVTPLKTKDFGRIAAQTAKHVIRQGIREAERSQQLSEIQSRAHDIVQATVTRVDPEKGIVALDLGKGGEAILPRNEQVPGEVYTEGQMLQVYIVDVVASERGPRVMISRTHPASSSACSSWKCLRSTTHRRGQGHQPRGRRPHQDGCLVQGRQRQPRLCLHRPPRRPCGRCGREAGRREDRHREVE